jgi:hypothetical protein
LAALPIVVVAEDNVPFEVIEVKIPLKIYLSCSDYRPLLEKYDWDVDLMMRIMQGESGCKADAVGDKHLTFNNNTQGMSCGLMQIRVLDGRPDCDTLKDPETNIEWAYKIYKTQGLRAWTVYRLLALK